MNLTKGTVFTVTNETELRQFLQTVKSAVASGKVKLAKGTGNSRVPSDLRTSPATAFNLTIVNGFTVEITSYLNVRISVKSVEYPASDGTTKTGDFSFNLPAQLLDTLALGVTIPLKTGELENERRQRVTFISFDRTQGETVPSLTSLIGGQSPEQELSADEKAVYDAMIAKGKTHEQALAMAKA